MWRRIAWVALIVVSAPVIFLLWFSQSTDWVRDRVVTALNERFAGQVELGSLQLALLPRARASGTGFVFRHNGRTDVPPLVTIADFNGNAGIAELLGRPVRLGETNINRVPVIPQADLDVAISALRISRNTSPSIPSPASQNRGA
jgi:hypothetical protein